MVLDPKSLTVLVVDDELPIREEFECFDWASVGARLIGTAANGEEALKLALLQKPDLVITDVIMPIMDGLTLLRHLSDQLPDTQTIVLTVSRSFEDARTALQLGAVDYIVKVSLDQTEIGQALEKARRRLEEIRAWNKARASDPAASHERHELKEVKRIIAEEYQLPLGLSSLASRVGLSPSYLSSLFAQVVKENFNDYLARVRIEHAVELLKSTNLKVYEVGERVGIPNYRYFTEVFKKRTGISPKEFQKGSAP